MLNSESRFSLKSKARRNSCLVLDRYTIASVRKVSRNHTNFQCEVDVQTSPKGRRYLFSKLSSAENAPGFGFCFNQGAQLTAAHGITLTGGQILWLQISGPSSVNTVSAFLSFSSFSGLRDSARPSRLGARMCVCQTETLSITKPGHIRPPLRDGDCHS